MQGMHPGLREGSIQSRTTLSLLLDLPCAPLLPYSRIGSCPHDWRDTSQRGIERELGVQHKSTHPMVDMWELTRRIWGTLARCLLGMPSICKATWTTWAPYTTRCHLSCCLVYIYLFFFFAWKEEIHDWLIRGGSCALTLLANHVAMKMPLVLGGRAGSTRTARICDGGNGFHPWHP